MWAKATRLGGKSIIRMQACGAARSHSRSFWRAGNWGQRSDLDKLSSCGAPQHVHATNCPFIAPDRKPLLDIRTIESFSTLRWATLRTHTESRHCVVSKISQSPASSHPFFLWHFYFLLTPPISSSLSSSVFSIHCDRNDLHFNFVLPE